MSELPFVDEHSIRIPASRDQVWSALRRYVDSTLGAGAHSPLTWILGTEPRAGFEIEREVPGEQLGLAGRHRFSVYRLVFELVEVAGETQLSARTYAEFPRLAGPGVPRARHRHEVARACHEPDPEVDPSGGAWLRRSVG